jgi:hypothetical protein
MCAIAVNDCEASDPAPQHQTSSLKDGSVGADGYYRTHIPEWGFAASQSLRQLSFDEAIRSGGSAI